MLWQRLYFSTRLLNFMHRFLRNQSCLRAIPRLSPSLIPHQKPCIVDPVSLANSVITVPDEPLRFYYPTFPIGYGFKFPTMVHGSGLVDMVPFTEAVVVYADSVKKKKMNKHKYRKAQGRKS
ncbi:uncharacterized protein LOC103873690 [Brassica rapa]|uniref:uncharacterized protein LOC103873690 n=1 Tax=Brassica campestris TaxID=3711 RepID=UPI00142E1D5E|nr:uncharacterized protein LOC103873690 [Brassica rapa]XP_048637549.1 uncharacterized protein LOC125609960 [Brassica napus]